MNMTGHFISFLKEKVQKAENCTSPPTHKVAVDCKYGRASDFRKQPGSPASTRFTTFPHNSVAKNDLRPTYTWQESCRQSLAAPADVSTLNWFH